MTLSLHVGRLASYKHRFRFMLQPTRDKVIIDLVELHDRELITSGFMEWNNYTKIDQTYGGHKTSGDDVHQP